MSSGLVTPNRKSQIANRMTLTAKSVEQARRHLARTDSILKRAIRKVGPCTLRPRRDRFGTLVQSIVSQQISVAAARTIMGRLIEAAADPQVGRITVDSLGRMTPARLRKLGVSNQKAGYLLDLRDRIANGRLDLRQLGRKSDDAIIDSLTEVRGIGVWTAQMFLMFCLGRHDVFPVGDLGLRNAMRKLYDLDEDTDHSQFNDIAENWHPYRTVASWYCWRSLESPKK